jgi:hypothetical protein
VPLLKKGTNPSIVNTASIVGLRPGPQPLPYAASKAAVVNMTKTLAWNLGPEIRVNAVAPGWMEGDWMQRMLGDKYDDLIDKLINFNLDHFNLEENNLPINNVPNFEKNASNDKQNEEQKVNNSNSDNTSNEEENNYENLNFENYAASFDKPNEEQKVNNSNLDNSPNEEQKLNTINLIREINLKINNFTNYLHGIYDNYRMNYIGMHEYIITDNLVLFTPYNQLYINNLIFFNKDIENELYKSGLKENIKVCPDTGDGFSELNNDENYVLQLYNYVENMFYTNLFDKIDKQK